MRRFKPNTKGKRLYKCIDCGAGKFLDLYAFNIRGGDRCMNCGGRLEPKSEAAHVEIRERRLAYNKIHEDHGSDIVMARPRKGLLHKC